MFTFGRSSVVGNRDDLTKMTRNLLNDDNWYSLHNNPYEASPRATTPQRHRQRDSWGDPIPFGVTPDNLEPSGDGDAFEKKKFQQYETGDIKYRVRGVFDDDWNRGGTSGMGRTGVASEKERGRRVSCGRDQTQTSFGPPDPHKSTFPTSRRRSTVSSGNSLTVPNYIPLYGVSGGVGESPVPQRRAQKDANRISLGSIFTFGSKMRMSSPSRAMDNDRKDREENIGVRSTSNSEKGRVHKESYHEKHSKRKNKQTEYSALSNEKEDYRDYYNSLYSTLVVDEDNGTPNNDPSSTHHRRSPERFRHPASTPYDLRAEKPGQPRPRAGSRQTLTTSVGHPYAPYAHQGQDHHARGVGDEKLYSPTSDDTPLLHQNHPYNQSQTIYTRHPYGQSSVSTGASSPSHLTAVKRGSGQSDNHGECQHLISHTNKTAVASGIGITNTGLGGVGLGQGIHGKKLKISRSTPNFHHTQIIDFPNYTSGPSNAIPRSAPPVPLLHMKHLPPPKTKDRWLSAETWCDALLFPRPKLKLKQGKNATIFSQGDESFLGGPAPSSGRIISPPPSPIVGEWDIEINGEESQLQSRLRDQQAEGSGEGGVVQKQREPGIPSRVLAHSKSVELHKKSGKEKSGYISDIESRATRQGKAKAVPTVRDRSDTQYILPPTLVPDLDEVLSEGRLLDEERQAWQTLAVNSFGNKRSRSLSRTRTKSLTRKGRPTRKERDTGADESDGQVRECERRGQSSFEYLAAQACLGNQTVSAMPLPNSDDTKASGVHSHSNSQSTTSKTIATKSSKSQPKAHSRNNSAGISGVNAGRISVSKLCGNMGLDVDLDLDHVEKANLVSHAATQGANTRTAPDLEDALKRHGTKVIRLADPAHIPVDKGTPVSQPVSPNLQNYRKTPSPDLSVSNLSVISHSKVGIAIGTPPEEAGGAPPAIVLAGPMAVSASYVPSHPYAQGGLSFSVQTSPGRERHVDSCGPPGVSSSKVPPISEILARHKVTSHPYALSSENSAEERNIQPSSRLGINVTRDSYLAANGLVGQFRSDDRQPDPSRMWAQLSPDVIREILPGDLQYSPYDSDLKGFEELEGTKFSRRRRENERMKSIHDTAGVAEALLSATTYEREGKVLHEECKDDDRIIEDIPETIQLNEANFLVTLGDLREPSHISSAHTIASSRLDGATKGTSTRSESLDDLETASHAPTSGSPSPGFRVLGSPNDLDSFQDLFYQPSTTDIQDSPASPDVTANVISWDAAVRNRRTGSSLTSLARQLGEEYEALVSVDANRVNDMPLHSRPLGARPHHSGSSSEGNLQFVLEEMASADSPRLIANDLETDHVFESANLPEDVYSLQASSIADGNGEDDDPTGLLRLGTIESLSTPAAVDVEHRISFNGETVFDYEDQDHPAVQSNLSTDIEHPGNVISRRDLSPFGLASQRPLTQVTRSSCMTTSDLSRMSGLSDFPTPPKNIYSEPTLPTHHFDGDNGPQPNAPLTRPEHVKPPSSGPAISPMVSRKPLPQGGQVEFGVNQSAVELAKSLSSPERI